MINAQRGEVKVKFVFENGKYLFDKESYKVFNRRLFEAKEYDRKMKVYQKKYPENSYSEISCAVLRYPRFDSATTVLFKNTIRDLNLKNAKLGINTFSLFIDKYGKIINFNTEKVSDKNMVKQIRKIVFSKEFSQWYPAIYYTTRVNYNYRFSIIVDRTFQKYDLKNKWSDDSNFEDFIH